MQSEINNVLSIRYNTFWWGDGSKNHQNHTENRFNTMINKIIFNLTAQNAQNHTKNALFST